MCLNNFILTKKLNKLLKSVEDKHLKDKIEIIKGDITEVEADAIVNPANSYGKMGGGVALAIKNRGGKEIEKEAMSKAPIDIGDAISTTAGKLKARYVIHAPTMKKPSQPTDIETIKKATSAALEEALRLKVSSVAFPGMGTGVGGLPKEKAAKSMIEVMKKFLERKGKKIKIILVAYDDELYNAFKKAKAELV